MVNKLRCSNLERMHVRVKGQCAITIFEYHKLFFKPESFLAVEAVPCACLSASVPVFFEPSSDFSTAAPAF